MNRRGIAAALLAAALCLGALPASAADTLRVGKASPNSISLVPLDVGMATGIFAKHGLDIQEISFSGGARMHQGMAAGAIDIGLGAGPELAFIAKGSPETAVAMVGGAPLFLGVIVPYNSPIKSIAGLKGKKIGVSSVGSTTYWLALELARSQGWGPDGVTPVTLGGEFAGRLAALRTGTVDATIEASANGYQLEESKEGRLLLPCSDYVKDYEGIVIFASNAMVKGKPDLVRRFLAGWFDTVDYMRGHKAETVRITRPVTGFDQNVEEREYDLVMPMYTDGKFEPKGLAVIERSLVDMKLLDHEPDMSKLYTEAFLPKTAGK